MFHLPRQSSRLYHLISYPHIYLIYSANCFSTSQLIYVTIRFTSSSSESVISLSQVNPDAYICPHHTGNVMAIFWTLILRQSAVHHDLIDPDRYVHISLNLRNIGTHAILFSGICKISTSSSAKL